MQGVNKVILAGRVGMEPTTNQTKSGSLVTSCQLATNRNTKDGQQETEWHQLVFFNKLAEIAGDYLKKGSRIYIEGSLKTEKYQDKNGGPDRFTTKIIVSQMQMLDTKEESQNLGNNDYDNQPQNYNQRQGGSYQNQNRGSNQRAQQNNRSQGGQRQYSNQQQGQPHYQQQARTNNNVPPNDEPPFDDAIPF